MAITQFSKEMKIIGFLSDAPVEDNSLSSSQEFKDKFDEGGKAIKEYINGTLLDQVAEKPVGAGVLKADGQGNFEIAASGKDYQPPILDKDIVLSMLADEITSKLVNGSVTVELPVGGWEDKAQTVDVEGVKANSILMVSAAPASHTAYSEAQIRATSQAEGKVTFACEDVPEAAVSVVVVIVG